MFGTGLRVLRFQLATGFGKPLHAENAQQLVRAATRTLEEFGSLGDDVVELFDGPALDADMEQMLLERTVRYLSRTSFYYQKLFAACGFPPRALQREALTQVPVTTKAALLNPQGLLAQGTQPFLSVSTSGRAGPASTIWLSRQDLQLRAALAGMDAYVGQRYGLHAFFQVNISLQDTLSIHTLLGMADLLGARVNLLGLVPPVVSVQHLLDRRQEAPTVLVTSPGYLSALLQVARKLGLGPRDFRLQQIECSGDILSTSLAQAASQIFGAQVSERYRVTEIDPAGGQMCRAGHLHLSPKRGIYELLELETGRPAREGELATLVVTPTYPYALCMPLFRYDTRDVVRCLPQGALTCELAHLPATSPILGRAEHLLRVGADSVTTRALVEACDALPSHPWSARLHASVTPRGLALQLPPQAFSGLTAFEVLTHFQRAGLPVCTVEPVSVEQEAVILPRRGEPPHDCRPEEGHALIARKKETRKWPRRYLLKPLAF